MPSIVIAGSMAQRPGSGGHTWVFLQYLLGFKQLGWQVTFIDRLDPVMCLDETGAPSAVEDSWNLRYFVEVLRRFGLGADFGLLYQGRAIAGGLNRRQLLDRVTTAAALVQRHGLSRR